MTIEFTRLSSMNGDEPTELLKPLAYEYLAELNRREMVEFLETVGSEGQPVLLVIIPNVKVVGNKLVEIVHEDKPVGEAIGNEISANTEEKNP